MRGLLTLAVGLLLLKVLWDYRRWRHWQRRQGQREALHRRHQQELFQLETDFLNAVLGEADYRQRRRALEQRQERERRQLN